MVFLFNPSTNRRFEIKLYEIQVRENGEFVPIKFTGGNCFTSKSEAIKILTIYKNKYPHRLTMRVKTI